MRIDYQKVSPEALKPMMAFVEYVSHCSIEQKLRHLLELRVSLINGCAYCIDMHANELRSVGETKQRIDCVSVWHEVPFYTDREKAALAWAEAVTLISQTHVPDEVFEEASKHFSEAEIVDLNTIVIAINSWNRLAITFRAVPPTRHAK